MVEKWISHLNGMPQLAWGRCWKKAGDFLSESSPRGWYIVRIVPLEWGGPPPKIQAWSHTINFFH